MFHSLIYICTLHVIGSWLLLAMFFFTGDALLALWKSEDTSVDLTLLINKAIICSIAIQEECDNYMTDVGVLLGVKIALSVGKMQITHVGVSESKQFDLAGTAVDDVNAAEKWAEPGSIILSRLAFMNCDQSLFLFEILDNGLHYRVRYVVIDKVMQIPILQASMTSFIY